MIYKVIRIVLLGLVLCAVLSGCGGGRGGGSHRLALTEANLQQIDTIGADITAKVDAAIETTAPDEAYAEVARQVEGSPGVSSATADETSLTVHYDCGAVEQWVTPVQPIEPVDFQQLSRSIEAKIGKSRLTTPIAKSVWINPFHDQPGEFFQKASALKDRYRDILTRCGYDHQEVLDSNASVEFFATKLSDYGVVVLGTHGGYSSAGGSGSIVTFGTGTSRSRESDRQYAEALRTQQGKSCPELVKFNVLYIDGLSTHIEWRYGITPEFIRAHYPEDSRIFNHALFITYACHSLQNDSMAKALADEGVYTYVGWTESDSIGPWRNLELLMFMAAGESLSAAFDSMRAAGLILDSGGVAELTYAPQSHGDFTLHTSGGVVPEITLSSPTDGLTSGSRVVTVSGSIENYDEHTTAKVSVNGVPGSLALDVDGNFSHDVAISSGSNTIVVTATNWYGSSSKQVTVTGSMSRLALWTELNWSTDETDVDMHLLRPGGTIGDSYDDCSYFNRSPDWGTLGYSGDDPALDVDDTDGYGPEHITMTEAVPGRYTLFVHFFSDHGHTWEDTNARVAISTNGGVVQYFGPRLLTNNSGDRYHGDFWFVCYIDYPSGTITAIDDLEVRSRMPIVAFPRKQ